MNLNLGIKMTYNKPYEIDVSGEIKMWRACFMQHIADLLYSQDTNIRKKAKSFTFVNDPLFAEISLLINHDIYILRKNIIKMYKQQKRFMVVKKNRSNYRKKINEKIITKLAKDLLYA